MIGRRMVKRALATVAMTALAGGAAAAAGAGPTIPPWGFGLAGMDTAVKPGDNFWDYANGGWAKTVAIPADRAGAGSFLDIEITVEKQLGTIVDALAAKPAGTLNPDETKLRALYDAFENTGAIDAAGLTPAQGDLTAFAALSSSDDVARTMARLQTQLYDPAFGGGTEISPFDVSINPDKKDPSRYAVYISQGGLGLPNREYFLSADKNIAASRDAYKAWLAQILTMAGRDDAAARADRVFALEAALAKVEWSTVQDRDEIATYNPMTVSDLEKLAPGFPWATWLGGLGIPLTGPKGERTVVVAEKSAFPDIARIFAQTPVSTWQDYLTAHYMHAFAGELPTKVDDANFAFYGTQLSGTPQQLSRRIRGLHLLDQQLGFALGKLYVARYFPPEAKAKAQALVANLRAAYRADIPTLTWMGPATKRQALEKLTLLTPHIGYPDKWVDYSSLQMSPGDLLGDVQRAGQFRWHRALVRLDGPVDKSDWIMTPQTVNAYYDPLLNEIVFPASILQAPFFDPDADPAVNYGGIGAVIGHEMSHGYDDQGARYDAHGVLRDWWTPADLKAFQAKTAALAAQYDQYEPVPGIHINGKQTLGENIADLAGLTIAHKAYDISLGGKPAPVLNGFTGDQRFFLGFAQDWRMVMRPNAERRQLLSDVHSLAEFRAVGATRNMDAWYKAFDVQPGTTYYLPADQRVTLW
jgi:putative endopeptidase